MLILGLLLCGGGVWLASLGGSWAYLFIGLGLLGTGILLATRRSAALAVYAALLVATLAWALWEVGLDRWALVPRGAFLAVVGLWLLLPWMNRSLHDAHRDEDRTARHGSWRGPRGILAAAMVLVVGATLASMMNDPFDLAGRLPDAPTAQSKANPTGAGDDWMAYGGTELGQRYSTLTDITPQTIGRLREAWVFHTGDTKGPGDPHETTFEVSPLKIGDTLFLCTPHDWVIALDAATGKERWRFDPHVNVGHHSQHLTCRGLGYLDQSAAGAQTDVVAAPCTRRVFLATIDARLIALDAADGKVCVGFGESGTVDLKHGMPNLKPGYYMVTSPPVVAKGMVIVGGSINDNLSVHNPSGVVRGFDAISGKLTWNFDPGRPDQTSPLPAGQHYTAGAPNNWAPASVDPELGLVFLGLGNRSPDQLGADRSSETERFSSAIVALDVVTGKLHWVFQAVHHDLWDRDIPSQPSLIELTIGGTTVPALVGPTKQGDIYVLDRRTGEPIFPVMESAVPASTLPGETAAARQPHSALSFMPAPLQGKDMWGATPFDQLICRIQFRSMRYEGPYTPPSTERVLVYPGNLGVFNWGSVAVDPVRQVLIGAPAFLAFTFKLVPRPNPTANVVSAGDKEHWNENYGASYAVEIGPFMSPLGLPCQAPPWGAIAGADLRTGKIVWMHRNGTVRDQMPSFLPIPFPMGVAGLGGQLITAGGVAFYSGTLDYYLRAYDVTTGRKLWQSRLPAGGQATPITYRAGGRQMVVVAAGGHGSFGTATGDAVVAYALE